MKTKDIYVIFENRYPSDIATEKVYKDKEDAEHALEKMSNFNNYTIANMEDWLDAIDTYYLNLQKG